MHDVCLHLMLVRPSEMTTKALFVDQLICSRPNIPMYLAKTTCSIQLKKLLVKRSALRECQIIAFVPITPQGFNYYAHKYRACNGCGIHLHNIRPFSILMEMQYKQNIITLGRRYISDMLSVGIPNGCDNNNPY